MSFKTKQLALRIYQVAQLVRCLLLKHVNLSLISTAGKAARAAPVLGWGHRIAGLWPASPSKS